MVNSKCRWECPEQWSEWSDWLAAGLHATNRWRLPVLLLGILFASGRRTVTTWLRAAGVSDDFQGYYYFLAVIGRKTESVATELVALLLRTLPLPERLLLVIDDSPTKTYKTFLATYPPVGCVIRVVLIKEDHGWYAFFCTDSNASVQEILEAFADRATIEQDFHDVKEVWGSGQQQVRNVWTNLAVYNLNLWMHTLVELWAWNRSGRQLVNRSDSPWDDADRRPSHADRRKALRQHILDNELSAITAAWLLPRKIIQLAQNLMALAA